MTFLGTALGLVVFYWLLRPARFGRDIARAVKSYGVAMGDLTKKDLE